MPMPPILETIDWESTFNAGVTFPEWLNAAEESKRTSVEEQLDELQIAPDVADKVKSLSKPVHIVAIAEDWCGDVIRHVPVLEALAALSDRLQTRYIAREPHKDVFVRYLTNGGEAIPKFIFLSDAFVECGNWGPMPQQYKDLISRGKACGDVAAAREIIHDAYKQGDDRRHTVAELCDLILIAGAESVT